MWADKKEKIISSAYKLFSKYWYKNTSVDLIVKKTSIAKGTFYLYFDSKDDLYFYIIDYIIKKAEDHMEYLANNISDIKIRLVNKLIGWLYFVDSNPIILNLIFNNSSYYSPKINYEYVKKRHIDIITKIISWDEYFLSKDENFNDFISKLFWFFPSILKHRSHFESEKDFYDFCLSKACIIVEWLMWDYLKLKNKIDIKNIKKCI